MTETLSTESMRTFCSAAEVHDSIGAPIGPGSWVRIDQHTIDAFADVTGDHQWVHVDPERAKTGPYGATIVHGYLLSSLLPVFAADLYHLNFGSARVNYGANKVRYPAPVPVGSRIRPTATPTDCSTSDRGTLITVKFTVEVENGPKPALAAEILTLVVP